MYVRTWSVIHQCREIHTQSGLYKFPLGAVWWHRLCPCLEKPFLHCGPVRWTQNSWGHQSPGRAKVCHLPHTHPGAWGSADTYSYRGDAHSLGKAHQGGEKNPRELGSQSRVKWSPWPIQLVYSFILSKITHKRSEPQGGLKSNSGPGSS